MKSRYFQLPLAILLTSFLPTTPSAHADSTHDEYDGLKIEFEGGSLADLLVEFRKNNGGRCNLVISPVSMDAELPQFELHRVSAEGFTRALGALLPEGYMVAFVGASGDLGCPVITISGLPPSVTTDRPSSVTQTFSIAGLTSHFTAEEAANAVVEAWALDPRHQAQDLRVKLHLPTKLLIVTGPAEGINIAMDALNSMRETARVPLAVTP